MREPLREAPDFQAVDCAGPPHGAGETRHELRVNEVGISDEEVLPTLGVVPIVNVFSDLILREAVALLNFALKLISLTINRGKVVIVRFPTSP